MIGGVTKFNGKGRDARALAAHLAKPQPGGAEFAALNSAAADISAAIAEARVMAAAAGIGDRPFLHVHLSPSGSLDRDQLLRAAEVVCRELGVTDQPVGIELHGKPRSTGEGELHAHLVIGRAGASAKVLPSGYEKIKVETACRVAEFVVGDRHVLGRHFRSSVKHLEAIGRHDVVASLRAAHGDAPPRPQGMSPEKRMGADRRGVDVVVQREAVRAAWSRSDDGRTFTAALAEAGLELRLGAKAGVWLVVAGSVELGSVDRLVGERRRAVAIRLRDAQPTREPAGNGRGHLGHDEAGGPRSGRSPEDAVEHRADARSPHLPTGGWGPGEEPGPGAVGSVDRDGGKPVISDGPSRTQPGADREAPCDVSPAIRRNAVAALTVSAVSCAGDALLRLRRMAQSITIRNRDAIFLAQRRDEERRLSPPEPVKPLTVSQVLQQQREGSWIDPDEMKARKRPAYRAPRP